MLYIYIYTYIYICIYICIYTYIYILYDVVAYDILHVRYYMLRVTCCMYITILHYIYIYIYITLYHITLVCVAKHHVVRQHVIISIDYVIVKSSVAYHITIYDTVLYRIGLY